MTSLDATQSGDKAYDNGVTPKVEVTFVDTSMGRQPGIRNAWSITVFEEMEESLQRRHTGIQSEC